MSSTHWTLLSFSLIVVLILPLPPSSFVMGDMFTAQVDLEALFPTQASLIEAFEVYLANEDVRLKEMRRRLVHYIERGKKTPHEVISNPISAFLLLKGLTIDLDDLVQITEQRYNERDLAAKIQNLRNHSRFPVNEDLNGAAVAITRLQDTYQLETADIARGDLKGHCCANKLSSEDLFELGRLSYTQGDMDHTILWMHEALEKFHEERQNSSREVTLKQFQASSESDILEYLAFSVYQKGELVNAIQLTEELLRLSPNHPRAGGNIFHYRKMLDERKGEDEEGVPDKVKGDVGDDELGLRTTSRTSNSASSLGATEGVGVLLSRLKHSFTIREKRESKVGWEKAKYEALCRGEQQRVVKNLRCRYHHGKTRGSILTLAPVKEELIYDKPKIWIYHDIISDAEMQVVKTLARPKFKRATVHDHATGELVTAQYRISKSSWLQGAEDPVVDRVNRRIASITGLDLDTAEELQVVNYGLGGHYEPHFDFARRDEKDAFKSLGTGNRIATYLMYMSEVVAGGATVFPSLDLTLYPVKGAAAFWYNLLDDGVGDVSTRHAACPVLLGSKWVSNKWIHERGQEFRRPCGLKPSGPPDAESVED